jgi:hypothetical protein
VTNHPLTLADVGPSYLGGPATGVHGEAAGNGRTESPSGFALSEAFPNPFNPTTTIQFQIPTAGRVSMKIYDRLGREAATLIDGIRAPGHYQVRWDAAAFPSGLYFCRLVTDRGSETRKLALVK